MSHKRRKRSAFSLIELSIVLIIIGLLVAGVTGGASLIKSSELRSVITEARNWSIAVNSFYNQFDALPGDYNIALGDSVGGDGDGKIEYNNGTIPEGRNAWYQMNFAAILDSGVLAGGSLSPLELTTGVTTFGAFLPASKIKSSGWDFDYNTTSEQNVVVLTSAITGGEAHDLVNSGNDSYASGAITPTDALSIDSKFDDGVANTGKIRGVLPDCNNAGATYDTTSGGKVCALSYQVDINS